MRKPLATPCATGSASTRPPRCPTHHANLTHTENRSALTTVRSAARPMKKSHLQPPDRNQRPSGQHAAPHSVSACLILCLGATVLVTAHTSTATANAGKRPGYTDTPLQPEGGYRVHDADRPLPPSVAVPHQRQRPTPVPSDADILLGPGTGLDRWVDEKGAPPKWKRLKSAVEVVPKSGSILTKDTFQDVQFHVEWKTPGRYTGKNADNTQHRGNSGIFFANAFEVQILECHQNPTYADGTVGALYGQFPPLVNACAPAGSWNHFDIIFRAPGFRPRAPSSTRPGSPFS